MNALRNPSAAQLNKALAGGHKFDLSERVDQVDTRTFVKPNLLTNLFNPVATPHYASSFQWDVETSTIQRVGGKSYSEDGPSLKKNTLSQLSAVIPSFGVSYEVSAEDVILRRKAGSGDVKEAISDLMAEQAQKMFDAYDILNEDGMRELLVNDNNLIMGGPFAVQNWSTVYEGSARAAATDLDTANAAPDVQNRVINDKIDLANENLQKRGKQAQGYVMICGKNFFYDMVDNESSYGDSYDIRPTLNLAVEAIPSMKIGNYFYRNFTSTKTGVTYILYTGQMTSGEGAMIPTESGYLVPVGVSDMFTIELAPDITLDNAGELAQATYLYYEEDRHQVRVASSTNRLFRNQNPNAIVAFVTGD